MNDSEAVMAALANAPALLVPLVREVPPEIRDRRPAPGRWSAHEHACHLAEVQPIFLARIEQMLAEDHPTLTPYAPPEDQEEGALLAVNLEEALARYVRERAQIVERLQGLPPEAWGRTAEHPEYRCYSIFHLARHLAIHDQLHAYRIEALLLKRDWPPQIEPGETVAVEAGIPGSLGSLHAGGINVLGPFSVPGLSSRYVRIYLPRTYDPEAEHYALYMFDGQNVFDDEPSFSGGWHLHQAVERLAGTSGPGRPVPVVVGIDHGGQDRVLELSPFPFEGEEPKIDLFLSWVTGSLMPALAAELKLIRGPIGAVVGGSSMGGLAAFYAHLCHPEAFGGALVMSPSFWVAGNKILEWVVDQPLPEVSRIYLDCGAREGRGSLMPIVAAMAAHLASRGYEDDRLLWRPDARGAHNEASWRRRLPKALRFLYR
ncbi:MAG TPA: alpha/beta hydrolase-fold protein [Thermoanaerobaculia bacterium]|nr:alpha/beta hydrolase-fold protein [Thermoanaerobaculia bacterium]